jgi:L-alanine-DL-glutamate epimerase-like enolase superfamily enzyme
MQFSAHIEERALQKPFRISGAEWTHSRSLVVQLFDNDCLGRGEAQGVFYLGETADLLIEQVNAVADEICKGISRPELQQLLPSGGARNAVDCALWDLECKMSGQSIWQLTGITPKPVTTVFTLGLENSAQTVAENARKASAYPVLKIKLDAQDPVGVLSAIRQARPDAKLVVDVNQGWSFEMLQDVLPKCVDLDLSMVEQPLKRGHDDMLEGFDSPISLCADESCLDSSEMDEVAKRYDMINIKLDKTGGLTEALNLAEKARQRGKKLMVGNMVGSSLSMAPSFVIAQLCEFVDIDGPLLLQHDHLDGMHYHNGVAEVFKSQFWG